LLDLRKCKNFSLLKPLKTKNKHARSASLSSFLFSPSLELHLPPKPTTTPTPNVYTTAKTRKTKQQQHHQKNHHENKAKDPPGPNQVQREAFDASAQSEGRIENEIFKWKSFSFFQCLIGKRKEKISLLKLK
jgi:hypothetical protein